jgi:hypothetical protein
MRGTTKRSFCTALLWMKSTSRKVKPSSSPCFLLSFLFSLLSSAQWLHAWFTPFSLAETFIEWSDPEVGITLCLSFQDAAGCSDVWYATVTENAAVVSLYLCMMCAHLHVMLNCVLFRNVISQVRRKQQLEFWDIWFASWQLHWW